MWLVGRHGCWCVKNGCRWVETCGWGSKTGAVVKTHHWWVDMGVAVSKTAAGGLRHSDTWLGVENGCLWV